VKAFQRYNSDVIRYNAIADRVLASYPDFEATAKEKSTVAGNRVVKLQADELQRTFAHNRKSP
jgi:hypothetical protein